MRPISVHLPNGGVITTNIYYSNQVGVVQSMGNGQNADTETQYDGYGRISRVAVANGQSSNPWYQTDYCYDATGLLQFQSLKYQGDGWATAKQCSGNGVSYIYDALGRVTSATNADGTVTTQYTGRAVKTTDVNNVQKITQYDLLGRISAVCEISPNSTMLGSGSTAPCVMDIAGVGFTTSYAYDLPNHKTTITQGVQQRVFTTDNAGRTISTSEPERGATAYSYSYNSTGLQITRTRPQANQTNASVLTTTTTQYDSLGRPVTVSYNDGVTPNMGYVYDAACCWTNASSATNTKGMLVVAHSLNSVTAHTSMMFSYDLMGNVTSMWQCAPSTCPTSDLQLSRPTLTFSYDLGGNLTGSFDGASGSIAYGRSPAGEITSITNQSYGGTYNPPNTVSNVVNGPLGPISYLLGNGLSQSNIYDSVGRLQGGWVCNGSPVPGCSSQAYGYVKYSKGSRITSSSDDVTGQNIGYSYDEFNRLTAVTGPTQTFSNTYDRWGNRWTQTAPQGGPTTSYIFNTSNNQNTSFSYDAAGNLATDGVHSYTYDAEGNLLTVDGGMTAQYVYDALNRRVRTQTATSANEYLFDYAGRRISTWTVSNNAGVEGRVYWDGKQIAYRAWDGSTYFDHQDWLGTERARTNYAGADASSYVSLPWGDGSSYSSDQGPNQDNLHFAQLDHDAESATEHAQFRQYSPMQGRWMSPDPYDGSYDTTNPQSLNRYSYALNSPLSWTDPLGLWVGQLYQCGTNEDGSPIYCLSVGNGAAPPNPPDTYISCTPIINPQGQYEGCSSGSSVTATGNPSNVNSSAPSNGNPWYKNPCIQSALAKGAASTAIDAVGLLPEGGAVAGAFSLWHGAAGVSNGINILARVQFGAAIISTASAGSDASGDGAYSLAGAQLATGFASIGVGLAKAAPIVGQVISGISVAEDLYGTYKAVAGCHP